MTYRILTVCTGNICRSPMAEFVLREALAAAGLDDRVEVSSVGTSGWEIGNPVDPRAGALLDAHGIDASAHRARQMTGQMLREADLILALDHDHVEPIRRAAGEDLGDRLRMLRSFDPEATGDLGIRDPWYGDEEGFVTAWEQIGAATDGVLAHVREELGAPPSQERP